MMWFILIQRLHSALGATLTKRLRPEWGLFGGSIVLGDTHIE